MTFAIKWFSIQFAKRKFCLRLSIMNLQLHSNVIQIVEVYDFFETPIWMILYERHNYDKDISEIKWLIALIFLVQDSHYEGVHSFLYLRVTSPSAVL